MLGGQVGIADHRNDRHRAVLGAQSGVMSDVPAGRAGSATPHVRCAIV